MRFFAAAHSEHPDPVEAAAEVIAELDERMQGDPSLGVIFLAGQHVDSAVDVSRALVELIGVDTVLAVSVSGLVNGGREVQNGPGISAWIGDCGPVKPLRLKAIDSGRTILGLPNTAAPGSVLLLLADPFTFPVETLIDTLDQDLPGVLVVGGLASAGRSPAENKLAINGSTHTDGAVAVLLPPGVARPLVSQGCRPIGKPWVITEGSGQMIRTLGGEPAMNRLQPIIDQLSPEDRALAARGLHIGIVANESAEQFRTGDFLIRSIMGVDRESGALAIGDKIQTGQVIQFHVRDAASATADLSEQLGDLDNYADGALVFTCTGRGTHMFGEPHHDAQLITERFEGIANAGMFCAGEIGPVGDRNAVHGFTATMLLFSNPT